MNMNQAIAQSCDTYFYDLALRLGVDRIGDMARRFGLGEALGIELVGELDGLVPSKDWKLAVTGVPWQMGETLITGIGQAYLLATPLQLAVMTARLCNGGIAVTPKLSRRIDSVAGGTENDDRLDRTARLSSPHRSIGVSAGNLRVIMNGMSEVVNGKRGTARNYRLTRN